MLRVMILLFSLVFMGSALSQSFVVKMYRTAKKGHGAYLGTITISDSRYGMMLTPDLKGLTPGLHGMHIHQTPSCKDFGKAAGGHYDPHHTKVHLGPYAKGHKGDLPGLFVNHDGSATLPVMAPKLAVKLLKGRAIIIHAGSDNYSDHPKPLGGGGARIACGVIRTS